MGGEMFLVRFFSRIYDLLGVPGRIGVVVVLLAWLVVSFVPPSNRRAIIEWFGASGLYLALVGLCLVVSVVQTLLAFRGPSGRASADATH
jgi:protein-S-isoprenylcysteine O-methyltransferase Ste14